MSNGPPKFASIPDDVEWEEWTSPIPGTESVWLPKMPPENLVPEEVVRYMLHALDQHVEVLEQLTKVAKKHRQLLMKRVYGNWFERLTRRAQWWTIRRRRSQ